MPNWIQKEIGRFLKKSSFFIALVLSLSSVITSSSWVQAAEGIVDEGYIPPDLPLQGQVNIKFRDSSTQSLDAGAPYLAWKGNSAGWNGSEGTLLCTSTSDLNCKQESGTFEFFTRLSVCSSADSLDCLEGISAKRAGVEIIGQFIEVFPKKINTTYLSKSSERLPEASSGGFWKFIGLEHKGGSDYFVDAGLRGSKTVKQEQFTNTAFALSIIAASKAPLGVHLSGGELNSPIDDGSASVLQKFDEKTKRPFLGAVGIYPNYEGETLDCVMSGDGLCATRHAIPADVEFNMAVRLSSSPSGWMHGRLDNPTITIEAITPKPAVRLTIIGTTTRVPVIGISQTWQSLPQNLKEIYSKGGFPGTTYGCRWCSEDPLKNTLVGSPPPSGSSSIAELKAWIPAVNDKASANINTWSIRTLSKSEMNGADKCFDKSNQINGVLMTNSTTYSAGPPAFKSGTLTYQVAAPHFMSDGSVMRGQYNLVIRSEVARCIYGFSSAPINAEVSVVNANGEAQIATVIVGEKNGWLYLKANNFEFSAPIIKVKLSQEADPLATPTPSASVKPVAKAVTITCIKGKTSKSVTAAKPKCPTGYKKK
jgi:hypothetical protein